MRQLCMTCAVVAVLAASPLRADDAADIRGVIGDQIAAFAAGDLAIAYSFASPGIRSIFPSPEIFGNMVRQGYPMIWRPAEVIYFGLRGEGGRMMQRMGFRDGEGNLHLFDYEMMPGGSGWRIDGVIPVREGGAAV